MKHLTDSPYRNRTWKDKRDSIIERDNHKCVKCHSTIGLSVHHKQYGDFGVSEVPDEWLVTLCSSCHEETHGIKELNFKKFHYMRLIDKMYTKMSLSDKKEFVSDFERLTKKYVKRI